MVPEMTKKRINLTIAEQVYKDLKKKAIDENTSVSQLLERIAKEYLEKEQRLSPHP